MNAYVAYPKRHLVVAKTTSPAGVKFSGEIDASNVEAVEEALGAGRFRHHALHVDLSDVSFCDVSGIRAIVSCAGRRSRDGRLLLHGLPVEIEKVLDVLGWSELPGLEFCSCEMGS